jgi:signal transduction protein with GAF and PtsI domain
MTTGQSPDGMQRRIAELEEELARMRGRLADDRYGEDLRASLTQAGAAGALASPTTHNDLLDQIVATAAHVLGANAASLFLVDEETEELIFEVALGEKASEVKKFRLPLGQGIAGFTAATGQALAVADVQQDPRWAQDIGQAVQYLPQSILSVPLSVEDRVTGVLELLDKAGGQPFSPADMETAGLFAAQAAIAIEQSRVAQNLSRLLRSSLAETGTRKDLVSQAMESAARSEESAAYRETLQIAATLAEISRRGDAARHMCQQIVEAIYAYLRSEPRL